MLRFQKVKNFLLDLLFPTICVGCDAYGEWLCPQCIATFKPPERQVCPVCRMQTGGSVCARCKAGSPLDGVLIATIYDNAIIQHAIHALKYRYVTGLANPLGRLLIRTLAGVDSSLVSAILGSPETSTVVPVPLHPRRRAERGFNQAELLAHIVSCEFQLPLDTRSLIRTRVTHAQAQLSRTERLSNVHGAFHVRSSFKKTIKNVILIDDVSTTLTTLNECAQVLKQKGVTSIWGLVLARGS